MQARQPIESNQSVSASTAGVIVSTQAARFVPEKLLEGDARALVLVHGFSGSRLAWSFLLDDLERERKVLAIDLVGHAGGRPLESGKRASVAALVDGVERDMDDAGLNRAHLVGSSLGGWIAFELAARGRAISVVAISPAGGWEAGTAEERLLGETAIRTHRIARLLSPAARSLVRSRHFRRALLRQVAEHGDRLPPAMARRMIEDTVRCPIYFDLLAAIARDGPAAFPPVEVPALVLWGENDRLLPSSRYSKGLRPLLARAEWVGLTGLGHAPMYDDPELIARMILSFAARAEQETRIGSSAPHQIPADGR